MEPVYTHCRNCGHPTTSETEYCADCSPERTRLVLNFGRRKRILDNLRAISHLKKVRPSDYVVGLIETDTDRFIADINRSMKR